MHVTLSVMDMSVKLVQLWKAPFPMLVTLSGMVIPVKLAKPENAYMPILVTVPSDGIMLVLHPGDQRF